MSKVVKEIVIDVVLFYFGGWIGKVGGAFAKIGQAVQAIALTRSVCGCSHSIRLPEVQSATSSVLAPA